MDQRMNKTFKERIAIGIYKFPLVVAILLVSIVYSAHVYLTVRDEHVNPFSNVEEWAYTNIAANNFLQFGFLNSLLLQDFSTSQYSEDHPFAYNHMPPGAENATAVILELTGHNYPLTRFFFAIFVLPGLYFFVRFAQLLFDKISIRGAPLVLLTVTPHVFISHMEAQIHSVFLLLGFAPLVWLIEHAKSGGGWRLIAAVMSLFILGIYVQYVLVAAIVFSLIYLWLLKVVRLQFKHVALGVGAIVVAVGAHLLQNFAYLGPDLFVKELSYTLGNRTVGIPTKEELHDFYQAISLVHHGSRPVDPGVLTKTILRNLRVPQWPFLLMLLLASATIFIVFRKKFASALGERPKSDYNVRFRHVTLLYIWAGLTVVSVIFLFPAFAQDVNLGPYGVNHLILGIPSIALIMSALELGHGGNMFPSRAEDEISAWHWRYLYAITLLGILHIAQFRIWPDMTQQLLATGVFLVCLAWSWAQQLRFTQTSEILVTNNVGIPGFPRMILFLLGAVCMSALAVGVATEGRRLIKEVRAPSYLEPIEELKKFNGNLFLTNINKPIVGFFVKGHGYGVCGLEAVGIDGEINSSECKISFARRADYWHSQRPDLFFFFWNPKMFPGFSDCQPLTNELPEEEVALGTCIRELRDRLQSNFPLVHSNSLFEVYDLKESRRGSQ